jgi:predicted nucleic acid-binding Zn ribbon protein
VGPVRQVVAPVPGYQFFPEPRFSLLRSPHQATAVCFAAIACVMGSCSSVKREEIENANKRHHNVKLMTIYPIFYRDARSVTDEYLRNPDVILITCIVKSCHSSLVHQKMTQMYKTSEKL